jgi:nucleotide-binding universal stress UspA family protein
LIKDIMVRLNGTSADSLLLEAAKNISQAFDGKIIGLLLNPLPLPIPLNIVGAATIQDDLLRLAKDKADEIEAELTARLAKLDRPSELRRFDVLSGEIIEVATSEARSADTFVDLRPNGALDHCDHLVEEVLFGSGRHLFLMPQESHPRCSFDHALIAWNGSRESTRAMAEAMPYLHRAQVTSVIVVDESPAAKAQAVLGFNAVEHLKDHGIDARLSHLESREGGTGTTLVAEAKRLKADLIVMGGYGHSRLHEWLLGGVTYELLHNAPVPLVIAH